MLYHLFRFLCRLVLIGFFGVIGMLYLVPLAIMAAGIWAGVALTMMLILVTIAGFFTF